jgi:RNA polymerase sigma-70 factor (ECF subfamily)
MAGDDDIALMLRFQERGDSGAFDVLFRRHRGALLSYLVRLSGNVAIAEDVSQHAWCRLIDAALHGSFDAGRNSSFRAWLYAMARNRYIDEHCRRQEPVSSEALGEEAPAQADADPLQGLERTEQAQLLKESLAQLPFEQRDVIALWSTGMEIETLTTIIGAPRDTVLSRKKYALAKLRRLLMERGVERSTS